MKQLLQNTTVQRLSWTGVTVAVRDRQSQQQKVLVDHVSGQARAGELMAIMGPSGSGKTTLLNVLAHRPAQPQACVTSQILLNDHRVSQADFEKLSRFVESRDVLIGALTVKETLSFAARLGLGKEVSSIEHDTLIRELLEAFGLVEQADCQIGTLVKTGISTGQKRRLSIAAQLISAPKILFLDEPTSGLDSTASFRVMSYLRDAAKAYNILVICSIHQPSSTTFQLFDKILLISKGRLCYSGGRLTLNNYFKRVGHPIPVYVNPAEFILDLVNVDFEGNASAAATTLEMIQHTWYAFSQTSATGNSVPENVMAPKLFVLDHSTVPQSGIRALWRCTWILLHRSSIKSTRDVMVYGGRLAMYIGLAVLIGTVWLRLEPIQENIAPFAHSILFGSTFMSFMAVVYVPAFLEDYVVFAKDRINGLYSGTAFMMSNFLIGLPSLFVIAFLTSAIVYWLVNFRPDGVGFMVWVMWTYLNLLAAESLVVLVSSLFPNFIGALAAFAMVNSIFMACNGFMVPRPQLRAFYRYTVYYINYQGYVFRGLSNNEFRLRSYSCGRNCSTASLSQENVIPGTVVLQQYDFQGDSQRTLVGIVLGIILTMRIMAWAVLKCKE